MTSPGRKTKGPPCKAPARRAPARTGDAPKVAAKSSRAWVWALAILAVCLLALDFVFPRHGEIELEAMVGFYGLVAAGGAIAAVLGALALRAALGRREDYYDE